MMNNPSEGIQEKALKIKLVIFDVDGVLTDGTLSYSAEGESIKHFNVKDGLGIKLLMSHGIDVAVISARQSLPLQRRIDDLGIQYFFPGVHNKLQAFDQLIQQLTINAEEVAYVGDDVIDIPVMKQVGLSCTVQDGYPLVKEAADWVTDAAGGAGAAREVADLILSSKMALRDAYYFLLNPDQDKRESPSEASG